MERGEIASASNTPSMGGERAVAAWDEDSLTMAVEAGLDCLRGIDPKEIDGLFFATTSSPFKEKQATATIASALDMRKDVFTCDITSSLRAGTSAIKAAFDSIKSGSSRKVLVIAADCRVAMPRSAFEQIYGDGAAALLIGDDQMIADIEVFSSVSDAIPGVWRREEDLYPKIFEPKLDRLYGLIKNVGEAVGSLMVKCNLETKDISKFALYGPDPRSYRDLARFLKIDPRTQLQDPLFDSVGITGTPHPLLLLIGALEGARPGDRIVCASYGDGSDAFLIKTTDRIEQIKGRSRGTGYVSSKKTIPSYGKFADFKKIRETGWPPQNLKASVVKYWRDEKWELPLYGMRCKKCGTLQYPISRCCMICGEKDNHEDIKLSHKGKIFSFTHDYLLGPGTVPGDGINAATRIVADMDDGCRLWLEMTDSEVDEVYIDMPIELTFRLFHQKGDFRYYSWRARPVR